LTETKCCPASYIGQTGHRLQQRLDEHKCAIRQADFNALITTSRTCVDWTTPSGLVQCCSGF